MWVGEEVRGVHGEAASWDGRGRRGSVHCGKLRGGEGGGVFIVGG